MIFIILFLLCAGAWFLSAVSRSYAPIRVDQPKLKLELEIVAPSERSGTAFGRPVYTREDVFFVRGIGFRPSKPLTLRVSKDGKSGEALCEPNPDGDCYFTLRLPARAEGSFELVVFYGSDRTEHVLSFTPRTRIFFPRIDGMIRG